MNRRGVLGLGRWTWPDCSVPFCLWAVSTLVYSFFAVMRHFQFETSGMDLGIFDQALWHYSRFEAPASTINPHSNLLGDHFHPLLMVLAPLYWVFPHVETLLVAQVFLLTLAVFPLHAFALKKIGPWPAAIFTFVYTVFIGVQATVDNDFHEVSLGVLPVVYALYFAEEKRWGPFYIAVLLLALVREDACLTVACLGVVLFMLGERARGIGVALFGIIFFLLDIKVFIPFFADPGKSWRYWSYSRLGSGPLQAFSTILLGPWKVVGLMFSNVEKVRTFLCAYGSFVFLPFLSPWGLLTILPLLAKLLSDNSDYWGLGGHYMTTLSPVMAFAAIDGFSRSAGFFKKGRGRDRWRTGVVVFLLVLNLMVLPVRHYSPLAALFRPSWYHFSEWEISGWKAMALIPRDASVQAQEQVAPHLSERSIIRGLYCLPFDEPRGEDYVVACSHLDSRPFPRSEMIEKGLEDLERRGYRKVFSENGWTILERRSSSQTFAGSSEP